MGSREDRDTEHRQLRCKPESGKREVGSKGEAVNAEQNAE